MGTGTGTGLVYWIGIGMVCPYCGVTIKGPASVAVEKVGAMKGVLEGAGAGAGATEG